jgi:hypothetical protein
LQVREVDTVKTKLIGSALVWLGVLNGFSSTLAGVFEWLSPPIIVPKDISQGVAIQQKGLRRLQVELKKHIDSAPSRVMKRSGLAGAMGGSHLKVSSPDSQEVLLPVPQMADGQVPICYFISTTPPEAMTEVRLRKREDCNVVVSVRLAGNSRDVQIAWCSVILLASGNITPNATPTAPFCAATPCVQSEAGEIVKLAKDTWPNTGKVSEFAGIIQQHIRTMKRKEQPQSLDALGILRSGDSSICTANANLASALMRCKGIACRTIAVIPPVSQRVEMHRVVEFFEKGRWLAFDPSSVAADIPTKPWQNIIMAKTTTWDEQVAMRPRMGSTAGCPYGQEIEMLSTGVNLSGQDFFWAMAKPLAEFEPTDEAVRLATEAWSHYLKTGALSQGQIKAETAKNATELVSFLRVR